MTHRQFIPARLDQYVNHDPGLYSRLGLYSRPGFYSRKYGRCLLYTITQRELYRLHRCTAFYYKLTHGLQLLSKDNKFDLSLIPLPVFSHFRVSFCFSSYWFEFCQHLQDQKDPIGSCCEKLVFCLFCLPNLLISLVSYFVFMFVYVSCL